MKFLNFYHWYATDVLSDIRGIVRYDGMHQHSVPLYSVNYFDLEFSGEKIKVRVKVAKRET
jgi:hypothetical protein